MKLDHLPGGGQSEETACGGQRPGDVLAALQAELADARLLQEISTALIQEDDVEALYGKIMDAAVSIMRSDFASMQMLYPERGRGGELRLLAFRGFNPQAAQFWEWVRADSESTCGAALRTGQRAIAPDVEKCDYMAGTEDLATYLQTGIQAVQTTPLFSRGGKMVGMISTHWRQPHQPTERDLRMLDILARQAADLIERRGAAEALRASEAKYRTLFESIDEGFCIVEVIFDGRNKPVDYRFLEINPAFERQTGLTDARGRMMRELAPDHEEHWFEIYGRIVRTGQAARFELPAAGLHRWYDVYAWRYGDPDSRQVAVLFNDVTTRKRAEETLREGAQRKDEFLAMLSHEMRNPLAPIRNAVSLLHEADDDPAVRHQVRAILDRQVGHMIRLVDDLLDIARISRGSMDLQKGTVHLEEIISSAVETSRPLIEANRHRLEISLPPETITLWADRVRLTQVIANLLNNAAKYTPACGLISVTARGGAGGATITVCDNGYGIEPQAIAGVFEMFVQADSSRRAASGGLGIGLALARQLVELHGGSIEARSEGRGRGSEFTVRLPASVGPALVGKGAQLPRPEYRRRVLVVDDNVDAAESLGLLLRKMGHAVQLSYDGAAAIEAALREPPEIVLLDLDMPRLDGFAVAARLREDRRFDRIPIVALTGFGQEADRKRARKAGFDQHVLKPVEAGALRAALDLVRAKDDGRAGAAAMPAQPASGLRAGHS